ncbi:MAG: elongation factor Ts [Dehalococcoidia bacterium SM23_28_1]|nr:MAG: elongation factor Ts [Dehalococcoidia bacterium SM23_28_1]
MAVSAETVKKLRDLTGAGMLDCKKALEETRGDLDKAKEILRQRGIAIAEKKAAQETRQGLVEAYIHADGRLGALVELNCQTDFVARTDDFRALAHDLAMQVAATDPQHIAPEELPASSDGDPQELCLLAQPFIRDPSRTIQDLINDTIAKTGENIRVRRFARFHLGR